MREKRQRTGNKNQISVLLSDGLAVADYKGYLVGYLLMEVCLFLEETKNCLVFFF